MTCFKLTPPAPTSFSPPKRKYAPRSLAYNFVMSLAQCFQACVGGGGQGGRNPGAMGVGSVREAGEERAGDRLTKGAGIRRNRK